MSGPPKPSAVRRSRSTPTGDASPFRFRPQRYRPPDGCRWHPLGCRLDDATRAAVRAL